MTLVRRVLITLAALLVGFAVHALRSSAPASAAWQQLAIIEDDNQLLANPMGTLQTFRKLGANTVRVFVPWAFIAPAPNSGSVPGGFDATDPASYPAGAWDRWDAVVRDAQQVGLRVDFVITGGAPQWAEGRGIPSEAVGNPNRAWYPSTAAFGQFVRAVGTRYSGSYPDPNNAGQSLPRVGFWSIWNEPNFGEDLAPQATNGSRVSTAPGLYRGLVNAAWQSLQATGHGNDTIVIGELAARGLRGPVTHKHPQGLPGNFAQTKPMAFIRTLYCVGSNLRPLSGSSARKVGCPTNRSGSRQFRSQNPGLFGASGFADHPYPMDQAPNSERSSDPDFATFPELPNLWNMLDRVQKAYGSHNHFAIYNDEYGYITHPPNRGHFVSPSKAAYYINWAEFISWRTRRIASTMQYLLYDPVPNRRLPEFGGFASGLLTSGGRKKPAYDAYRLPLYLPNTHARSGQRSLEVWGCVRPAFAELQATGAPQSAQLQFARGRHGAFRTIATIKVTSTRGYFDTRIRFPASGELRLSYTYPANDQLLPSDALGATVYSRYVHVSVG